MKIHSLLQTLNSILNTQYPILFFILIICGLLTIDCGLSFAAGNLEVEGELKINSTSNDNRSGVVLQPLSAVPAEPSPQVKGEFYHNDTTGPYYYDGSSWKSIGASGGGSGKDRRVATKIVAASNSLDKTKADYVCDGTDDQVEIQQAINDLGSKPGAVYLLEGEYLITGTIRLDSGGWPQNDGINDSGKAIIGTGRATVLKIAVSANFAVILLQQVDRVLITKLKIDGNRSVVTGSNDGIGMANNVSYCRISDVWFENIIGTNAYRSGAGIHASNIYQALAGKWSNNIITNNYFINNNGGISAGSNWSTVGESFCNNIISNNIFLNNNFFGILTNTYGGGCFYNNVISNNIMQSNSSLNTSGIVLDGYCGDVYNNTIIANNIRLHPGPAINNIYCYNHIVTANNLESNWAGIYSEGGKGGHVISGNVVRNSAKYGIGSMSNNNIVKNNVLYENGTATMWEGYGIQIVATWGGSNNVVLGNNIYDSVKGQGFTYGINIAHTASVDTYLGGNLITGAAYNTPNSPIYDGGTNTKYTSKDKITIERKTVQPTAGGTVNTTDNPKGYVSLTPPLALTLNTTTAIADGKSTGDILILEGTSDTNTVTIEDNANVQLASTTDSNTNGTYDRVLGLDDILKLLWNGSDWVEIAFSDN